MNSRIQLLTLPTTLNENRTKLSGTLLVRMFPYWVKIVLFTLARFCATVRAVRQIFSYFFFLSNKSSSLQIQCSNFKSLKSLSEIHNMCVSKINNASVDNKKLFCFYSKKSFNDNTLNLIIIFYIFVLNISKKSNIDIFIYYHFSLEKINQTDQLLHIQLSKQRKKFLSFCSS